jgi:hypothetical protein
MAAIWRCAWAGMLRSAGWMLMWAGVAWPRGRGRQERDGGEGSVSLRIEGGAEPVQEADGSELGISGRARARVAQGGADGPK